MTLLLPYEVWRDIKGYEGKYQVSARGRVKSLARAWRMGLKHGKGMIMSHPDKIMHAHPNNKGYLLTSFCVNKKRKFFLVHRLMAQAFIPNPENKPEVNHIIPDPKNIEITNLEWSTRSENVKHEYNCGRTNRPKIGFGATHHHSRKIGRFSKSGQLLEIFSCAAEAGRTGMYECTGIRKACNGNIKSHKGFIWKEIKADPPTHL